MKQRMRSGRRGQASRTPTASSVNTQRVLGRGVSTSTTQAPVRAFAAVNGSSIEIRNRVTCASGTTTGEPAGSPHSTKVNEFSCPTSPPTRSMFGGYPIQISAEEGSAEEGSIISVIHEHEAERRTL